MHSPPRKTAQRKCILGNGIEKESNSGRDWGVVQFILHSLSPGGQTVWYMEMGFRWKKNNNIEKGTYLAETLSHKLALSGNQPHQDFYLHLWNGSSPKWSKFSFGSFSMVVFAPLIFFSWKPCGLCHFPAGVFCAKTAKNPWCISSPHASLSRHFGQSSLQL